MKTDDEIIDFLRRMKFVGLISASPNIEELLVPWDLAVTELKYKGCSDMTPERLKTLLKSRDINRRTLEEFYRLKHPEKARKTPGSI